MARRSGSVTAKKERKKYAGPERRARDELVIYHDPAKHGIAPGRAYKNYHAIVVKDGKTHRTNILKETGFSWFSEPAPFEWDNKRKNGPKHVHFIPRREKEPKDLESSGLLNVHFPGSAEYSRARSPPMTFTNYNEANEKYSRNVFPARRKSDADIKSGIISDERKWTKKKQQ